MNNLENSCSHLRSINEKIEKRIRYYETRALHQTIFYLIFLLIILSSVSHSSSSITCRNWWLPFSLSLICAFLFSLTYLPTISMYLSLQFEHDVNILQLEMLRDSKIDLESEARNNVVLAYDKFRMYKRRASTFSITFCLLAFTGLVLYACHSIPCADHVGS